MDLFCSEHGFDKIQAVPELFQKASRRCWPTLSNVLAAPIAQHRELAVLERLTMGESIKEIAAFEGITERTVRFHLQRIRGSFTPMI